MLGWRSRKNAVICLMALSIAFFLFLLNVLHLEEEAHGTPPTPPSEPMLLCNGKNVPIPKNRNRLWLCPLQREFTPQEESLVKQYITKGALVPRSSDPQQDGSDSDSSGNEISPAAVGHPPETMRALYEGQWVPAPEPLLHPVGVDEVRAITKKAACLKRQGVISTDHNRNIRLHACTIVRNRVKLVVEWIQYHRILGVEFFHIFDDHSHDGLREALEPFVSEGIVKLEPIPPPPYVFLGANPHHSPQIAAMGLCIEAARAKEAAEPHRGHVWELMADTDEFVLPEICLVDVVLRTMDLAGSPALVGAVAMGWSFVGCENKDTEVPVDNYRTEFERTRYGLGRLHAEYKSLVRVDLIAPFDGVVGINPHQFQIQAPANTYYQSGSVAELIHNADASRVYRKGDAIVLHYSRRSTASYLQRQIDGRADIIGGTSRPIENMTLTDLLLIQCHREAIDGGTPAGVLWYKFQQIHRLLLHGLGFTMDPTRLNAIVTAPSEDEKAHFPDASVVRTLWTTHAKSMDHAVAFVNHA